MNSANDNQDKNLNCEKKKTKATQKKKLLSSDKAHKKLQSYYCFQIEMNWSHHNHPVLYEDMLTDPLLLQNQYQQNLISNNPLIF